MKKYEINFWKDHQIKSIIIHANDIVDAIKKFEVTTAHTRYIIKLIIELA